MIESIRIWLQLIETVLDWQLVMDWESSGSIIKWWSLCAGNFLFITPRHTHTLVSFSTGDMFRFFRLFWSRGEVIFSKKEKKLQEYGACEMQILQIGNLGWKQTGSIMRHRCLWGNVDKLNSISFAEKEKCFLTIKLDEAERSLNKEKYCCICKGEL